jgi:hypothetical protein
LTGQVVVPYPRRWDCSESIAARSDCSALNDDIHKAFLTRNNSRANLVLSSVGDAAVGFIEVGGGIEGVFDFGLALGISPAVGRLRESEVTLLQDREIHFAIDFLA